MFTDFDLTALAIIPGVLLIWYIYKKDKVEKEPIGLIIRLVALGVLSCIVVGPLEMVVEYNLPYYSEGSVEYALQTSFLVAAFCEEIVKFLALRLGSWKDPSFNYRFDGIVYGVSAAVGFAVWENIMYVYYYGFYTAVVRAFTAVPLHAFCGAFMGVFYAHAKQQSILGNKSGFIKNTILALVVPMIVHGIYDTFAFLPGSIPSAMLMGFVVILYIIAIKTINANAAADYRAGFYSRPCSIDIDLDRMER
ncbi:MAG: PrsW family intramembrane metalloprotease [Mogibacterium sp.]|nr:PrsW family intramembrane metalloprotease [Mogibacterium sp.]